jgi:iron complex outermembrane receptor protein
MVDLFARIPSSFNETDYLNEPNKAGGSWLAIKGFEEYFRMLGGVSLESKLGQRLTNKLVIFSTYADPYESRPFNILDDQSANLGFREILRWDLDFLKFSAGVEYFHEWVDWKIYQTDEGEQGVLLTHQKEIRKHLNTFAMIQWRPTEKLLLDGGFNLNVLFYGLQTKFRTDALDQSGQYSYQPVLSPRLGLSYRYHKDHHLYASAGHGFSAPSLEETLLPEGNINTELRPETGWNFELGNRGNLFNDRVIYDATLYTILLNDLLVTERIAEDIFTGANAGKAQNSGLELWSTISLFRRSGPDPFDVKAILSYTISSNRFTDFVDDGISYTGNALPGIPFQILNTMLSARMSQLEMKVHFQHAGSQWMDDLNSIKYDGHQLLNFQASWKVKLKRSPFQVELSGGIRNIMNTHYASMILVNAPSFGGSLPRFYYPGNPRQFHLGASLYFR